MYKQPQSRAPLIVAIVLFLLALYVGSYFALVVPKGIYTSQFIGGGSILLVDHYRWQNQWCERIFWPLEQIDRKVRPGAWE